MCNKYNSNESVEVSLSNQCSGSNAVQLQTSHIYDQNSIIVDKGEKSHDFNKDLNIGSLNDMTESKKRVEDWPKSGNGASKIKSLSISHLKNDTDDKPSNISTQKKMTSGKFTEQLSKDKDSSNNFSNISNTQECPNKTPSSPKEIHSKNINPKIFALNSFNINGLHLTKKSFEPKYQPPYFPKSEIVDKTVIKAGYANRS